MRGFFLPELNVGFLVTHRSGSRLILNTLKYFFDSINKKYEYIDYHEVISYANKLNKSKFYIITRHPIKRFISGFTWILKNKKEYNNYIKDFKLETINDYVSNYYEIMNKKPNAHFLPQTYGILSLEDSFTLNEFENLNFRRRFDNLYYDYKIIHLEDIDQMVMDDMKYSNATVLEKSNGLLTKVNASALKIFDIFHDNEKSFTFSTTYLFFKKYLQEFHNANTPILLESTDYQFLMDFFYNEILFYGYNNFDLSKEVLRPNIINLKNFL